MHFIHNIIVPSEFNVGKFEVLFTNFYSEGDDVVIVLIRGH